MRKFTILVIIIAVIGAVLPYNPLPAESQSQSELQQQLQEIERQIADYEQELAQTQAEKQTLSTKIKRLKVEQNKISLEIQSTTVKVSALDLEINDTEDSIRIATDRIDDLKEKTADLLRQLHQSDDMSMIELVVGSKDLNDAFNELTSLERLSDEVIDRAREMKSVRDILQNKQDLLETQQQEAKELLQIRSLQEKEYQAKVAEQNQILEVTKGLESQYQTVLAESRKKASEIRLRLYELAGGATTKVTFGEAVEIAKAASAHTGVRAAFLLAILTQESSLGKNVGTCNRVGDPPEKSYTQIMNPKRDQPPFLEITKELGLDPNVTPVSCPMYQRGKRVGWGGAMGPAQFIPSTWMAYKGKVSAITGRPANPWDIRDAFFAAALLLKSRGATNNGRQGEWDAAMQYFSGSTNPRFRFYGDNVLKLADKYQAEMDALAGQ